MAFVIILVVAAFMFYAVGNAASIVRSQDRKSLVVKNQALRVAERSLRAIANGTAGNDQFEAQAALDEIASYTDKELN